MIVTQYETRFVDLSCHTDILILSEREKVRRFIDALTYGISVHIVKIQISILVESREVLSRFPAGDST